MEIPSDARPPFSPPRPDSPACIVRGAGMVAPRWPVNVGSVPHRSLFRYPGGKTWLVPLFRRWMQSLEPRPRVLIEPFAGGGIIGLTAAFEALAEEVLLVELDPQVAAVWQTVLEGDGEWLAKRILGFDFNPRSIAEVLADDSDSRRCRAFQTILRNRVAHGGILARGAGQIKQGEAGRGIRSRWYPETLARRIRDMASVRSPVRFVEGDGFEILEAHRDQEDAVFFIDPPYTAGGKRAGARLYDHHVVDHERLFALCAELRGDFLLTYDHCDAVGELAARHGFETKAVAMKNTHHAKMTELLIGRRLGWIEGCPVTGESSEGNTCRKRAEHRAATALGCGAPGRVAGPPARGRERCERQCQWSGWRPRAVV